MPSGPWSRLLPAALVTAVALGAVGAPAATAAPGSVSTGEHGVEASTNGRYLVQYASRTDVAAEARSLRTEGVEVRRTFSHAFKGLVVEATHGEVTALARDPRVVLVEPDVSVQASSVQENPPWGLDRIDQSALPLSRSFAPFADGAGVRVYVVDTGVRATHVDFANRVVPGFSALSGASGEDCNGHGTHVAGTVAGAVHGVAKAATVVPVRVLDCRGIGSTSTVIDGLDWILGQHQTGQPAVVNLSLGAAPHALLDSTVDRLIARGITVVAAAGNAATDACTASPARVPGVLTVAASDSTDQHATFSNHGACVDMYAPGVGIVSASHSTDTGTKHLDGTSMATPHVAGAVAVLLSQRPGLTPAEVAARLEAAASSGVIRNVIGGTPNRLVNVGATTPSAPAPTAPEQESGTTADEPEVELTKPSRTSKPKAAAKRRSAIVTWVQGDDGGSRITKQIVRVYRGTKRVGVFRVSGATTGVRVAGLRPGRFYRFTVTERNALGKSPESARSNRVRPRR